MRLEKNLGARRIQNELIRQYQFQVSLATIQKVLTGHNVEPLRKPHREKRGWRYSKNFPDECVQINTCKITPGLYQYTAVDDGIRYQVLELDSRRAAI